MTTYSISLLGFPPAQQVLGSGASALNIGGTAAGHASIPEARAVLWNPGPVLLPLLGKNSVAYGINDSGDVVGDAEKGGSFPGRAFLYRNGIMHDLDSVFGTKESFATDINNNGLIAAWGGDAGIRHAFLYDSQAMSAPVDLGVLSGHEASYAMAVNNKGQATGISRNNSTPSDPHAFLYDGGLNDLGPATAANDINDTGQVVGGRVFGNASHWTAYVRETSGGPQNFQDLGPLPLPGFVGSEAMAINNQGDVVGHSFTDWGPGQMIRAFIRPAGGQMQDLNSLIPANSGWLLRWALAINDLGQIAGTGIYYGENRAYLLTPSDVRIREIRDWAAIDPLALALSDQVYATLKLPDPPPFERLMAQIHTQIGAMQPEVKKYALERLKALEADIKELEKEMRKR